MAFTFAAMGGRMGAMAPSEHWQTPRFQFRAWIRGAVDRDLAKPLAVAVVLAATQPLCAQSITEIVALPGYDRTHVVGVSADGSVVVGYCSHATTGGTHSFRWTQAGGTQDLGLPPGSSGWVHATGVSGDGLTVVGYDSSVAWKWTQSGGFDVIPPPQNQYGTGNSAAFAVNYDGSVVVGALVMPPDAQVGWTPCSLYWTRDTYGPLPGFSTRANVNNLGFSEYLYGGFYFDSAAGVSGDGQAVLGHGGTVDWDPLGGYYMNWRGGLLWTASTGFHAVNPLAGDTLITMNALSADGTTAICDSSGSGPGPTRAMLFTVATGPQDLGSLTFPPSYTHMVAVSGDGAAVVGLCGSTGNGVAVLWTAATGMMDLNSYLPTRGVDLAGSQLGTLWSANAISADGTTIAGETYGDFARGWVVSLSCFASPTLPAQPVAASTCPSGTASFAVTAAGAGPFTYRWQVQTAPGVWMDLTSNGLSLPCGGSAHAATPTSGQTDIGITPCAGVTSYQVRCIVSNACGDATSNEAAYTVCYANCDCSMTPPVLNVADFTCFLQKYAGQNPDANCDGSTQPPILNVSDFTCFLQKYAAGCP